LEEHPEEAEKYMSQKKIIAVETISKFLNWNTTRVAYSLQRLNMIQEEKIEKEAILRRFKALYFFMNVGHLKRKILLNSGGNE
jgi:hypothetical protein